MCHWVLSQTLWVALPHALPSPLTFDVCCSQSAVAASCASPSLVRTAARMYRRGGLRGGIRYEAEKRRTPAWIVSFVQIVAALATFAALFVGYGTVSLLSALLFGVSLTGAFQFSSIEQLESGTCCCCDGCCTPLVKMRRLRAANVITLVVAVVALPCCVVDTVLHEGRVAAKNSTQAYCIYGCCAVVFSIITLAFGIKTTTDLYDCICRDEEPCDGAPVPVKVVPAKVRNHSPQPQARNPPVAVADAQPRLFQCAEGTFPGDTTEV